jgi:hypothetical protein
MMTFYRAVLDELFPHDRGVIPQLLFEKNGMQFEQKLFISYFNNIDIINLCFVVGI